LARHRISELGLPKQILLWGGRHAVFPWICVVAITMTPFAIGAIALWYNLRNEPMPGGVWNLTIWALVIVAGPVIARVARSREIARRKRVTSAAFISAVGERSPAIPEQFVLAVRSAIASIYDIPVDLITPHDTRTQIKALSLMSEPLALEMIARVDRIMGFGLTFERMGQTAEAFLKNPAQTVEGLISFIFNQFETPNGIVK
jgi:hypothetical protein